MNNIAKLALLGLRNVNPSNELSSDIVLFLMVCVIGWVKTNRILNNGYFSEYQQADMINLMDDLKHIDISSLVDEFLEEYGYENND